MGVVFQQLILSSFPLAFLSPAEQSPQQPLAEADAGPAVTEAAPPAVDTISKGIIIFPLCGYFAASSSQNTH